MQNTATYPDLGGGINSGAAPAALQTREVTDVRNFYPYQSKLRRRGGSKRLTTATPWDDTILGFKRLKRSNGTQFFITGGFNKFGKLIENRMESLIMRDALSVNAGFDPWTLLQYKDLGYGLRRGTGGLWRIDGYTAAKAGIPVPATALVLSAVSPGASAPLAAGKYKAVYTYGNIATGYEGNPSVDSNQATLDGTTALNETGYVWPSNPFVDVIRIYRTLVNQDNGVYYRVATLTNINGALANNVDTTPVSAMGPQVSYNNGAPPTDLLFGDIWNERLYASNGRDVRFSESLLIEAFGDENELNVAPDDGFEVRGINNFDDRLVIGKTKAIYYVTGTDRTNFDVHTLSDRHGVMSHHTMKSAENILYFYGSGKAVYRSDGNSVVEISDPRVKPFLEAIADEDEQYLQAAVFPELGWYVLQLPPGDVNGLHAVHTYLVYNYRSQVWSVFNADVGGDIIRYFADTFDPDEKYQLRFGTDAGDIFTFADRDYPYDDRFVEESYDCSIGAVDGIIGDGTGAAAGHAGANGFVFLCRSDGSGQQEFAQQANGSGFYSFAVPEGTYDLILYDSINGAYRRDLDAVVIVGSATTHMGTRTLNVLGAHPACS